MRVVVTNAYARNTHPDLFASWLHELDPDVALINECQNVRPELEAFGRLFSGHTRNARDVAVFLPDLSALAGVRRSSSRKLSPFVSHPFAPDRHASRVQLRRPGREVFYAVHANAVIQDQEGGWTLNAGAQAWRNQGLPTLARMLDRDIRRGRPVVVGGDMNAAATPDTFGPDPHVFFDSLGLRTVKTGFMWLAYTPEHYRRERVDVLETPPGADAHRALAVDLAER